MRIRLPEVALVLLVLFSGCILVRFLVDPPTGRSSAHAQQQLQAAQLEITQLKTELETVKVILESWQCKACELESKKLEADRHGAESAK